jgi:hypothetical protein
VTAEVYRKRGRSVRREGQHVVWVDEAGEAVEDRGRFRTRTLAEAVEVAAPEAAGVEAASREIESIVEAPLTIERLLVSEGVVSHQFGEIEWSETSRRVHLSIARPPLRVIFDLAQFQFDAVRSAAVALMRAGTERPAPKRIRLPAHVGAALLPFLAVRKSQTEAPRDGKGQPIEQHRVTNERPPNWFRPSYRVRPRRAWFHLRAEEFGDIDPDAPAAIALLAPAGRREFRVLCAERGAVYPATIPMRPILAARPAEKWYPYGAGAFGAELML